MAINERIPRRAIVALNPAVNRLLYQSRLKDDGGRAFVPTGVGRVTTAIHQRLFEHGIAPPWVLSAERCQEYWRSRGDSDDPNAPKTYASKPVEIVGFLNEFWQPEVTAADSVLEVGCNAGTNLQALAHLGFSKLAGVEINPAAINEMRGTYPELARSADIHTGRLEDVLPAMQPASHDVVFSMAVLIHLHPSSRAVFSEMVRIARKYVCVIEAERVTNAYVFARNYRRVFERLGAEQIREYTISRAALGKPAPHTYIGYTARLFGVPG